MPNSTTTTAATDAPVLNFCENFRMNRFQMMSDSPGGRHISQISAAYGSLDGRPYRRDKRGRDGPSRRGRATIVFRARPRRSNARRRLWENTTAEIDGQHALSS